MRTCLPVLLVFGIVSNAAADDWPQFRGPTGDGHAKVSKAPISWSETDNIVWKTAIHDKGWSSPVVWGDQIWMTTALESGKELFAVCVDRKSGKIVHDLKLFSIEKPAFCIPYNSYASCTPVIEPGRVYVHFGSAGTVCIDTATGKEVWRRVDLPCNHHRGPGSSPILHGGLLILTFDGFDQQYLTALDKTTGKTVWRKDRGIKYGTDNGDLMKAYSTPALIASASGDAKIISPSAAATVAYDPNTGEESWRIMHGGMNAASCPVFGHGLVFLTSGHTKQLLAVRLGGSGELGTDSVAWKSSRGVPSRPSMLLSGDHLFTISDDGIASCFEAKTGNRLWQERIAKAFCASPVLAAGRLYCCDEEGTTAVLAAEPVYKLFSSNKLAVGCMASPAILDDGIYLRTKTHLYRIGESK